jgi:hypothetical protein
VPAPPLSLTALRSPRLGAVHLSPALPVAPSPSRTHNHRHRHRSTPTLPSSPIHVHCRGHNQHFLQCSERRLQPRQATENEHSWQSRYRRTAKARKPQRRKPEEAAGQNGMDPGHQSPHTTIHEPCPIQRPRKHTQTYLDTIVGRNCHPNAAPKRSDDVPVGQPHWSSRHHHAEEW